MYQVKDYVVYGSTGVCQIIDIRHEDFGGSGDREYYVLSSVFGNKLQTYIPTDNIGAVMRPIMTKDEALELINIIPDIESEWIPDDNERKAMFSDVLQACDPNRLIQLVKMLYARQQDLLTLGKRLTNVDGEALKSAEKLLYDEYALILNIQPDQVFLTIFSGIEQRT